MLRVVLDTSVLIAGLRSSRGASHQVLRRIGSVDLKISLSVPLLFEYEAVTRRQSRALGLTRAEVDDVLDYLCSVADRREIFFLWRPFLKDRTDDMLLELAVEASCPLIITHNLRDFAGCDRFGVEAISPQELLRRLDAQP